MLFSFDQIIGIIVIFIICLVLKYVVQQKNKTLYNLISCAGLSLGVIILALQDHVFIIFAVIFILLTAHYCIEYIKQKSRKY